MEIIDAGFDFGNRRAKLSIEGLNASIPSIYAFDKPIVLGKNGTEIKPKAFDLLFRVQDKGDVRLWFGNDTLASENTIQKLDAGKYSKSHIQRLFQAVLYQWSKQHGYNLSDLGKLNVCVSMPPGSYQDLAKRKKAEIAYKDAFNTGQSHMKVRGKETHQIVTQFHSLVREAVVWGSEIPKRNELVLTIDLGGGTDDVVLFNGDIEPSDSKTYKTGLIRMYYKINPNDPTGVELKILKDKSYLPPALVSYFNQKELLVQLALRDLPEQRNKRVYLIGGGAAMINRQKAIRSVFISLLPPKKVVIKDQYANAEANRLEASK